MPHPTTTESESKAATATAPEAMPPTASPARSESRTQAAKSKSELPTLKTTNLKSSSAAAAMPVEVMDDRRRGRWASLSKSPLPPQPEILKASSAAEQQQQHQTPPSCASDHASHTKTEDGAATSIGPSDTGTDASAPTTSTPYTSKFDTLTVPITATIISERTTSSRGYVAFRLGISAGDPQTKASIPSSARPPSLRPRCTRRTHLCDQSPMAAVMVT